MNHPVLKKLSLIALALFALLVLPRAHAAIFDSIDSVDVLKRNADTLEANRAAKDPNRAPASSADAAIGDDAQTAKTTAPKTESK